MAEMIATLSDACEREFGFLATRLFRVFKTEETQGKRLANTHTQTHTHKHTQIDTHKQTHTHTHAQTDTHTLFLCNTAVAVILAMIWFIR